MRGSHCKQVTQMHLCGRGMGIIKSTCKLLTVSLTDCPALQTLISTDYKVTDLMSHCIQSELVLNNHLIMV